MMRVPIEHGLFFGSRLFEQLERQKLNVVLRPPQFKFLLDTKADVMRITEKFQEVEEDSL